MDAVRLLFTVFPVNWKTLLDPYFWMAVGTLVFFVMLYRYAAKRRIFFRIMHFFKLSKPHQRKLVQELRRKKFHLSGFLIPMFYYFSVSVGVLKPWMYICIIGSIALFVVVLEVARMYSKTVNKQFVRVFGKIMRDGEFKKISGSTYYLVGVTLALIVFPPAIASSAITCLIYGDFFAALVGMMIGKHKIYKKKTLEGLLGCVVACFVSVTGTLILYRTPVVPSILMALAGAVVAALTELWCDGTWFNDNLLMPFNAGAVMWLVSWLGDIHAVRADIAGGL